MLDSLLRRIDNWLRAHPGWSYAQSMAAQDTILSLEDRRNPRLKQSLAVLSWIAGHFLFYHALMSTITSKRSLLLEAVLSTLQSPAFENLRYLIGDILIQRVQHATDPDCYLIRFLAQNLEYPLGKWENLCKTYLRTVVSKTEAAAKAREDLLDEARSSDPANFNVRVAAFSAEMAAVGELSTRGYSEIVPLLSAKHGHTPDFRSVFHGDLAYVEVKNINSPIGIFDTFQDLLSEKQKSSPYFGSVQLTLHCSDDNTATATQKSEIDQFLDSIVDGPVPQRYSLSLSEDVSLTVEVQMVQKGQGRVMMTRGWSRGETSSLREDRFFNKVESTVRKALGQLAECESKKRCVVINVMTPDAGFPMEWNTRIRNIVNELSGGSVNSEILFFHRYLEPNES
jgi:hypothetical protein